MGGFPGSEGQTGGWKCWSNSNAIGTESGPEMTTQSGSSTLISSPSRAA